MLQDPELCAADAGADAGDEAAVLEGAAATAAVANTIGAAMDVDVDGDGAESPQDEEALEEETAEQSTERLRLERVREEQKRRLQAIQAKQESEVDNETRRQNRLKYLIQQADVFAHFIKSDVGTPGASGEKGRHKKGVSEQAEDELLLKEAADGDDVPQATTRLTVQPPTIKFGIMRDYQLEGLNWMIKLHESGMNGILADEMGLGKTLQTISLLAFLAHYKNITGPHLVIVPKSTLSNWMNEFKRWCPSIRAFKFHGNKDERQAMAKDRFNTKNGSSLDWDVCVTSYEVVTIEASVLKKLKWRYVIIDEAHRIKNENSLLAKVVRSLRSWNRLLITGTPLQNNLHELWALLNFLLPDIFSSSEDFDSWFNLDTVDGEDGDSKKEVITRLHSLLRPFLLRRIKSEVEKALLPKKEVRVYVGLSEVQRELYKKVLARDLDAINGAGERSRLLNVLMQLRKVCNHPYLFDGVEPGPPYTTGDHIVEACGKMVLLDKLLAKLFVGGHRVLLFSQMTRLLDILEDYLIMRNYEYCRIDGNTSGEDREASMDEFNQPGSSKFLFLLSTRAGGLGINLATADTVVIFDSDWNPQADLQAMDRAHRIGQKKQVMVYRLITEDSVEEKIIERAARKLALDAFVIQQGRLAEQAKSMSKGELQHMIKFGADKIFKSKDSTVTDEDIDTLLERGETKGAEALAAVQHTMDESLANFSMSDTNQGTLYQFEGVNYKGVGKEGKEDAMETWIEQPKREHKAKNYDENAYYRSAMGQNPRKERGSAALKVRDVQEHHFANAERISFLDHKALAAREEALVKHAEENPDKSDFDMSKFEALPSEEQQELSDLVEQAFFDWSKKDFRQFVSAFAVYGEEEMDKVAAGVENKSLEQVEAYAAVFQERYVTLSDRATIQKTLDKGLKDKKEVAEKEMLLEWKVARSGGSRAALWRMVIDHAGKPRAGYCDDEDKFIVVMLSELGYAMQPWEELRQAIREHSMFRFDWFIKSRTCEELKRRANTLIACIQKEHAAWQTEEEKAAKAKGKRDAPGKGGAKSKKAKA